MNDANGRVRIVPIFPIYSYFFHSYTFLYYFKFLCFPIFLKNYRFFLTINFFIKFYVAKISHLIFLKDLYQWLYVFSLLIEALLTYLIWWNSSTADVYTSSSSQLFFDGMNSCLLPNSTEQTGLFSSMSAYEDVVLHPLLPLIKKEPLWISCAW